MSFPTRSNNPMDQPKGESRLPKKWQGVRPAWTTTPPTEPGWYWAWDGEQSQVVNVYDNDGHGLQVDAPHFNLNSYSHWLGPLPVPDQPAE